MEQLELEDLKLFPTAAFGQIQGTRALIRIFCDPCDAPGASMMPAGRLLHMHVIVVRAFLARTHFACSQIPVGCTHGADERFGTVENSDFSELVGAFGSAEFCNSQHVEREIGLMPKSASRV